MVGFAPKSLGKWSFIAIEISARAVSMILPPLHTLKNENEVYSNQRVDSAWMTAHPSTIP